MQAVRLINTIDLSREEWLAWRRKGIGGSDIGAICGVNPWKSPVAVYLEKVGEVKEDREDNEAMHFGRVLEDVIAKEFSRRTGYKVQRRNAILQHPKVEWALANIDRLILAKDSDDGNGILEIKTANEYARGDWEEGKIPDQYLLQLQWYLFVTGLKWGYFATLVGGNKFYHYRVERDDEIIEYLVKICGDFWKMVQDRTPPEMDGSQSSTEVLKFLYPESKPESIIELPPTAEELIAEYEAAAADEKAAKERKEAAANKIKALMGENETAWAGDRKVSWKTVVSNRFDSKRFKKDYPELYEMYAKQSQYRRFSIK
ncbi:MAG: YqaJ viral recombinase family protein [Thermoanaerobacteraceae bacterium]|nr:YqaJ viral recombinase family protein [Thermoanaerobacteraceae bacterium]